MPLPILNTPTGPTPESLVRLFHKTELHWTQHLGEETELSIGSAFMNPKLSEIDTANRLLGAALPEDCSADDAIAEVAAHYQSKNVRSRSWVMNPSAPADRTAPLIQKLEQSGHRAATAPIFLLSRLQMTAIPEVPGLRIIPARASFKHAQMIAQEIADVWKQPQLVESNLLHLDDPHWDALIALQDGKAVAQIGVLAVGEIGRIQHIYVAREFRGKGIGRQMMSRAMEVCARSLFKQVFLSCRESNTAAMSLYAKFGFQKIGEFVSYVATEK